jgi:hypothetical protein
MTRALPFTQASAERVIKAARKQDLKVTGITVNSDGAITIHTGKEKDTASSFTLTAAPKLRDAREKFRAS